MAYNNMDIILCLLSEVNKSRIWIDKIGRFKQYEELTIPDVIYFSQFKLHSYLLLEVGIAFGRLSPSVNTHFKACKVTLAGRRESPKSRYEIYNQYITRIVKIIS